MQIDVILIVYILIAIIVMLTGWLTYMHIKVRRLLAGKDAQTLEDTLLHAHTEIQSLRQFEKDCLAYFTDVEKRLSRAVQAVETVRFNPFKGVGEGGNQSFSTLLVNERGDGVVLSTLNSRDHISIFSKPIVKYQSEHGLTDEELSVIENAKNTLKK